MKVSVDSMSPRLGKIYTSLGLSNTGKKQYKAAIDYFNKAFKIQYSVLDSLHPEIAETNYGVGIAYSRLKDFNNALKHLNRTKLIIEKKLNPNSLFMAHCAVELAKIYKELNQLEDAKDNVDKSYNIFSAYSLDETYEAFAEAISLKKQLKKVTSTE